MIKTFILLISLAFALADSFNWPGPQEIPSTNAQWNVVPRLDSPADLQVCVSGKRIALTFDDGPGPGTPAVLDYFDKIKAKTTFFVLGGAVIQNQDLLKRAYQAGHQIALHTWSHPYLTALPDDRIIAEIMWNMRAIKSVIGVVPRYIRPPYGSIDNRVRGLLTALGLRIVQWSDDSSDWKLFDPVYTHEINPNVVQSIVTDTFTSTAQGAVRPIVLFHDVHKNIVDVTIKAIEEARSKVAQPVDFVTVGTCVGDDDHWYFKEGEWPKGL